MNFDVNDIFDTLLADAFKKMPDIVPFCSLRSQQLMHRSRILCSLFVCHAKLCENISR